jgi:nucleoside 2-deoxyribosyltransferase
MIIYISGKYTGTPEEIKQNIEAARKVAVELWNEGYTALCPHLNTAHFENDCSATYEDYIQGDLELLSRCDAMVLCPNYKSSTGAKIEIEYAKEHGIPIYEYPKLPELIKSIEQDHHFINTLMAMYRMYLKKSRDYSTANILGTGEVGLVTRLWDKMARLMNLTGFELKVETCEYKAPKAPKNESVMDTYSDLANYAVIGQLLKKGQWGK